MAFIYDDIVPWGRSYNEYSKMFSLTKEDLDKKIVGCGDGPASFNAEMTKMGKKVKAIDPIYELDKEFIEKRIEKTYDNVIEQTYKNRDKFVWESIKSVDELGKIRMDAMKKFIADYEVGKSEGRYLPYKLPVLPFGDKEFELALCSHFLFLYSDNLTLDFHIEAINEMFRIAKEVRIFPILDYNGNRSKYVDKIISVFKEKGIEIYEEKVDYEFQKGGNMMLIIK